ncbi:DUF3299 domain-containing protein [uncultured Paraglaciecola sp.]|uniref:DUF3299 domain-containing protein n=1 Tax=uncultured Paraglaciecola sp. TaxID=1765024 RepID=UPI0025998C82|nr:DUF3299 domain-containing protein [uncultured Paraglaciecola sp.]
MYKLFTSTLLLITQLSFGEPLELYWEDMIPKDYVASDIPLAHSNSMQQQNLDAPIVPELNGKLVKIPGFVVPLEGDNEKITEFLLVPYFGACVHVPPPPPNQIVYVKFSKDVSINNLYDAVWVTGTLSTSTWQGDLATVGYTLQGLNIDVYD